MNLSWLLPEIKGIPVLMYHKVMPGISDSLTITPEKLREQWLYLKNEGYQTLHLTDFLAIIHSETKSFPPKSILITFDDGYYNNYKYAYPLLQELGWQATFFIIAEYLTKIDSDDRKTADAKMTLAELKQLDPSIVQLGLHGFKHENFNKIDLNAIEKVMTDSIAAFDACELTYHKVLAYPYGARPKDAAKALQMKNWMQNNGIKAAFRIGNQVCSIPNNDKYELKRIDILGTDTLAEFKIKLQKGKLKPF